MNAFNKALLFPFYGYNDGVSLREALALLQEEGLLRVLRVGLAVVDGEVEESLALFLLSLMETKKKLN